MNFITEGYQGSKLQRLRWKSHIMYNILASRAWHYGLWQKYHLIYVQMPLNHNTRWWMWKAERKEERKIMKRSGLQIFILSFRMVLHDLVTRDSRCDVFRSVRKRERLCSNWEVVWESPETEVERDNVKYCDLDHLRENLCVWASEQQGRDTNWHGEKGGQKADACSVDHALLVAYLCLWVSVWVGKALPGNPTVMFSLCRLCISKVCHSADAPSGTVLLFWLWLATASGLDNATVCVCVCVHWPPHYPFYTVITEGFNHNIVWLQGMWSRKCDGQDFKAARQQEN